MNEEIVYARIPVYVIWCFDTNQYLKEIPPYECAPAILAFTDRKVAEERAANHYGFDTYMEVSENAWAEVRELNTRTQV